MVLVLKNHQMENLLPMSEEIAAIEHAFVELGQGKAMNAPRARLRTPSAAITKCALRPLRTLPGTSIVRPSASTATPSAYPRSTRSGAGPATDSVPGARARSK